MAPVARSGRSTMSPELTVRNPTEEPSNPRPSSYNSSLN
jgi:hypothetical protein